MQKGDTESIDKLRKLEAASYYPYGKWTQFGKEIDY